MEFKFKTLSQRMDAGHDDGGELPFPEDGAIDVNGAQGAGILVQADSEVVDGQARESADIPMAAGQVAAAVSSDRDVFDDDDVAEWMRREHGKDFFGEGVDRDQWRDRFYQAHELALAASAGELEAQEGVVDIAELAGSGKAEGSAYITAGNAESEGATPGADSEVGVDGGSESLVKAGGGGDVLSLKALLARSAGDGPVEEMGAGEIGEPAGVDKAEAGAGATAAITDDTRSITADASPEGGRKAESQKDSAKVAGSVEPLSFKALLARSAGQSPTEEESARPSRLTNTAASLLSEEDANLEDLLQVATRPQVTASQETEPVMPANAQPAGVMAPAGGQIAQTVGSAVGRAVVDVAATPFLALSSAAKHLSQRFGSRNLSAIPPGPANAGSSMMASLTAAPLAKLETITHWKCEKIEKAASEAVKAAAALSATEEFVVWDDKVRAIAKQEGTSAPNVVSRLHEDPELAPLREEMNALWNVHADKVSAFKKASIDFVRSIGSVTQEYPNSEAEMQKRVGDAIESVIEQTEMMPGFGVDVGDYHRKLADRVREVARKIAEFIQRLTSRLTGVSPSNELTV